MSLTGDVDLLRLQGLRLTSGLASGFARISGVILVVGSGSGGLLIISDCFLLLVGSRCLLLPLILLFFRERSPTCTHLLLDLAEGLAVALRNDSRLRDVGLYSILSSLIPSEKV